MEVRHPRGYDQRFASPHRLSRRGWVGADITAVSPAVIESNLTSLVDDANTGALYTAKGITARLVARGVAPQLSGIMFKGGRKRNNGPSNVQASSWNEIVALGCAYQRLRSTGSPEAKREDFDYIRYYTMLASLLVCAPSRVSELWRTAADIVVLTSPLEQLGDSISENSAEDLDFKLALVWHPVRGGAASHQAHSLGDAGDCAGLRRYTIRLRQRGSRDCALDHG